MQKKIGELFSISLDTFKVFIMQGKILVTGGAGYIGSHTAMALYQKGYEVIILDNLSTGHKEFMLFGEHVIGDISQPQILEDIFKYNSISAVMHFAGSAYIGESVENPAKYYSNNVVNSYRLLDCVRRYGIEHFIFSSTCATYGLMCRPTITETHPQKPINPYGNSKLAIEWMLKDFAAAYGFSYTILRYFNAAGALPAGYGQRLGEWHEPETHIIPLALQAALGKRGELKIFGTDYDTEDGTCIRDYIHVCDLADAHVRSLERLMAGEPSSAYNLSTGRGHSVLDIASCVEKLAGAKLRLVKEPRRPGDPPVLVADSSLAVTELEWSPAYVSLAEIIMTALEWEIHRLGCQKALVYA